MIHKVYILTDEEYDEKITQEFQENGFEVIGVNSMINESVDLLFCYKMSRDVLKQKLNETRIQYSMLAIAYLSENVKYIFCDKPTLIIKDASQIKKTNVFQKEIRKEDTCTLIREISEWVKVLDEDIRKHGMPLFYKIKSEEVSCRMISFDEQYPVEFKLV